MWLYQIILTVPHPPYNKPLFYKGRKLLFVYDNGTIRTVKWY